MMPYKIVFYPVGIKKKRYSATSSPFKTKKAARNSSLYKYVKKAGASPRIVKVK